MSRRKLAGRNEIAQPIASSHSAEELDRGRYTNGKTSSIRSIMTGMHRLVWLWLVRHFISRRYRVELDQPGRIKDLDDGPVLIFPNHPAYIDPPLILSCLPWRVPIRPLVYTDTYRHPMLRLFVKALNALEVPDLRRDSKASARKMVGVLRQVKKGLQQGDSFLVYPSGRLQRDGMERLYAARSAYELIKAATPETKVVLLRSRGLWGSRFSCAQDGEVPNLGSTMRSAVLDLCLNLWWWMPKRRVAFSHAIVVAGSLKHFSRDELNRWFEAWYDSDGGEAVSEVPTHFLVAGRHPQDEVRRRKRKGTVRGWRARAIITTRRLRSAARNRVARHRPGVGKRSRD